MIKPEKILELIGNKKEVIAGLLRLVAKNHKQAEGCAKLHESITREESPNHSQANINKCIEVSLRVSAHNSQDLMDLAQILVVYVQSDTFTQDAANLATKLGHGNEALKAMFSAKMGKQP